MTELLWEAINIVAETPSGRYEVSSSLDGRLWDCDFKPANERTIQLIASGLESFDAAREACAEHYVKMKDGGGL